MPHNDPVDVLARLDARSFHAFERGGSRLLFDRETAATLELSAPAYAFFSTVEREGAAAAVRATLDAYPELAEQDLRSVVAEMVDCGMFRYHPTKVVEQDDQLEALWQHHPYRIQLLMAQG